MTLKPLLERTRLGPSPDTMGGDEARGRCSKSCWTEAT